MVLRPSAHNQLTAHRAAAKESRARMRATIADIGQIIQHSRKVIDDGREAMRRVDDLLQTKKPQLEFPGHLRPKLIGELLDFQHDLP